MKDYALDMRINKKRTIERRGRTQNYCCNSIEGGVALILSETSTQALLTKSKLWVTEEILLLMNKKTKIQNNDKSELGKLKYKFLKNQINTECKKTKLEWWNLQCQELKPFEK